MHSRVFICLHCDSIYATQATQQLVQQGFDGLSVHRQLGAEASTGADGTKRAAELAVFHQDIFLLDPRLGSAGLDGDRGCCLRLACPGLVLVACSMVKRLV